MTYTYPTLLRQLYEQGRECYAHGNTTKELLDVTLTINQENFFYSNDARPLNEVRKYLLGELAWYMSGDLTTQYIQKFSKFWVKLEDEKGNVNSNYGYLVFYKKNYYDLTPFDWCFHQLINDAQSRQAIILYNDQDYYYNGNKDFICTQLQQFFIRDNQLTSIVYIRSSDAILGLSYDIPWWSFVQQQFYLTLKMVYPALKNGLTTVHVGSSHLYASKFNLVEKMLKEGIESKKVFLKREIPLKMSSTWYEEHLNEFVEII